MITIEKNGFKIVCTSKDFENRYKHEGYQIVPNNEGATKTVAPLIEKEEEQKEPEKVKTIKDKEKKTSVSKKGKK